MILNKEKGQRMWGGSGGSGSGGSGGIDPSSLAGYATQSWVNGNFVTKPFWNQVFEIHGTQTVTVTDENDDPVGSPVVTDITFLPNEAPGTTTSVDEETGYTTTTVRSITSIEAKVGLWTNSYLSALGQNSSGGGGGGATLFEPLLSINESGLAAPAAAQDGMTVVWDNTNRKWKYGATGGGNYLPLTGGTLTNPNWGQQLRLLRPGGTPSLYFSDGTNDFYICPDIVTPSNKWVIGYDDGTDHNDTIATEAWVNSKHFINYEGDVAADFNFADGHDIGGGVYQLQTVNTQTHKPATYGILVDFESVNGHLQLAAGHNQTLYIRSYWWTDNPDGFTYPEWQVLPTQSWIGQNYLSKTEAARTYLSIAFFNRLFQARNGSTAVNPNDTTSTIDNIKAMFGFWTDQYLSALGQNSGGGGGGVLLEPLLSINESGLAAPAAAQDGMTVVWDNTNRKWKYGATGGGNYLPLTGGTLSNPAWGQQLRLLRQGGTPSLCMSDGTTEFYIYPDITTPSNRWTVGYSVGGVDTQDNLVLTSDLSDMATKTWVRQNAVDYVGDVAADFNFADGHDIGGGVYQLHTSNTQTHKPETYGILVDFESVNGHLQLAAGHNQTLYIRSYWWTGNPGGFAYPDWQVLATQDWVTLTATSAYAARLATARTLWGQSFDGTANISGDMTGVGSISANGNYASSIATANDVGVSVSNTNGAIALLTSTNRGLWEPNVQSWLIATNGTNSWLNIGNVGIGNSSPSYKLDVNGTINCTSIRIGGYLITADSQNGGLHINNAGLYADDYISALGASSGGGGGGGGSVSSIGMTVPTGFSVSPATITTSGTFNITFASGYSLPLTTDVTKGVNAYGWGNHANAGYATQTWVKQQGFLTSSAISDMATQTWVGQQGFLTSSAISDMATKTWVGQQGYLTSSAISDMATKTWVGQQGFVTSSAISDMATKTWVGQNYLGINATAAAATKLATARTIWGQSFDGSANVSGTMYDVVSIVMTGSIIGTQSIEMNTNGVAAGHGGFIDFHYGGSDVDYSSRIIEEESGRLTIQSRATVADPTKGISKGDFIPSGLIISGGHDESYLQIGDIRLIYDQTNNALKVEKYDGTTANFYATGGVSALGVPTAGSGTVDTLNVNTLKAISNLYIGDNNTRIYYDYNDDVLTLQSGSGDISFKGTLTMDGSTTSQRHINTRGGNVYLGSGYLYLSSSVYLYTDGSNVKVNINGTTYTLTKS